MRVTRGKAFSLSAVLIFVLSGIGARAQQQPASTAPPAARRFTIEQAVQYALANYPSVRAALEQYNAARAGVGLAKTDYLPRLDGVWQGDRGSRESVLGVLLPQSPNILTGSQGSITPHSNRPFWTSGAGFLLSWEPFDFGYRRAEVRAAEATRNRTAEQIELTRLGVATAVAEASLATLADQQRAAASLADVNRRQVFARSVHALVDAHLRPGADASRADAELAVARTQLILAEQNQQTDGAALAAVLGLAGTTVEIVPGPYLQVPPSVNQGLVPVAEHPAALVEQRRVQEEQAKIRVLNRAYYPHFTTEALISTRGSGQESNGNIKPGASGLGFDVYNWEAGVTAQLDLTSIVAIHQKKKVEVANRKREEALYAQTVQQLTGAQQQALARLAGAQQVAANTPTELAASRQSETQALARFRAGLGTIVDVAEAQSLLAQAEVDDSLARLSVWRALASLAASNGSLTPFFDTAHSVTPGGH